jgi:hypothetical protein
MSRIMFKNDFDQSDNDIVQSKSRFSDIFAIRSFKFSSLRKNNGVNPQNVLLVSATLTFLSVLITWMLEILANEILLHY